MCRSNFWHTNKGSTCSPVFYPRTSNSRSRGHRSWWQWPRGTYLSQPTRCLFLRRSGTGLVTQSAETSSCPIWLSSLASVCHSAAECHHNTCFCRQLLPFGNCHACGVDMYCTVPIRKRTLFLPSSKMPKKMTAVFLQHINQGRAHPQTVFGSPNPLPIS